MSQDYTAHAATPTHPSWCDPGECTTIRDHPYGTHQSTAYVIPAETPSGTVIETHLTDADDDPTPYLLTLPQARRLHDALAHLLTIAAPDQAGTAPRAVTSTLPPI